MAFPLRDFKLGEVKNLINYKYVSVVYSVLQRFVYDPLFMYLQTFVPKQVTPNQLTLLGFLSMLISFLITLKFDYTLTAAPRFLSLANFILLAFYFTMDNIDGLHARATGRCSPLGNILDHGVDSCCCLFTSVGLASSLGTGMGSLFAAILVSIQLIFYFGVLHQKYVGFFFFGTVSGCVEGITAALALHLSAAFGLRPGRLFAVHLTKLWNVSISVKEVAYAFIAFLILFNIIHLAVSVLKGPHRSKIYEYLASMYIVLVLTLLYILGFMFARDDALFSRWVISLVFSCVISTCYIEETVSMIVRSKSDTRLFVISFVILSLTIFFSAAGTFSRQFLLLSLFCCLALFFIRTGSTICNICKKGNYRFIM